MQEILSTRQKRSVYRFWLRYVVTNYRLAWFLFFASHGGRLAWHLYFKHL